MKIAMNLRTVRRHAVCLVVVAISCAMECGAAVSTPGGTPALQQNGEGYLGVVFENLNSQQRAALQVPPRQGVAIAAVDHDAPAGTAGLRSNDVIVQMNGKQTEHAADIREALHKMSPGQTVTLRVLREGRPLEVKVVLADRKTVEQRAWAQHYIVPDPRMQAVVAADERAQSGPPSRAGAKDSAASGPTNAAPTDPPSSPSTGILGVVPAEIGKTLGSNGGLMSYIPYTAPYTGITVDVLTPQLAKFFGLKDTTGLLVKNIDPKSPGARAGVQAGDVIVEANETPMTSRSKWIHALRGNRHDAVKLQILRNRQTHTVLLTLAASKS